MTRAGADSTGMRFNCSQAKCERLAEMIERYLAGSCRPTRGRGKAAGLRCPPPGTFRRSDGEVAGFEVCDISLTVTSLKTSVRPPNGEIVTIGSASGRVTRHLDGGIALEFIRRSDER